LGATDQSSDLTLAELDLMPDLDLDLIEPYIRIENPHTADAA
jgi:hypothetical protein